MAFSKTLHKDRRGAGLKGSPAPAPTEIADPATVTVTAAAAAEMKRQLEKRGTPDAAIRVGLRGGGCSGYSYLFDFEERPAREKDHVIDAHGVTVYVDHKSMKLLAGTVLDFVSSMMGYGFKFHNPNAKSTCGCGESVDF